MGAPKEKKAPDRTYLLPAASSVLNSIVGFQLNLLSQEIISRLITPKVVSFQMRQDRSDSAALLSLARNIGRRAFLMVYIEPTGRIILFIKDIILFNGVAKVPGPGVAF
jgi:hypothetical protein